MTDEDDEEEWEEDEDDDEFDSEFTEEWDSMSKSEQTDRIKEYIMTGDYYRDDGSLNCRKIADEINEALGVEYGKKGSMSSQRVAGVNLSHKADLARAKRNMAANQAQNPSNGTYVSDPNQVQNPTVMATNVQPFQPQAFQSQLQPVRPAQIQPPTQQPTIAVTEEGLGTINLSPQAWLEDRREQRQHEQRQREEDRRRDEAQAARDKENNLMNQMFQFMTAQINNNSKSRGGGLFGDPDLDAAVKQRMVDNLLDPPKDNTEKHIAIQAMELLNEAGVTQEVVGMIRDIPWRKNVDPSVNPYAPAPGNPALAQATQQQPALPQQQPQQLNLDSVAVMNNESGKMFSRTLYEAFVKELGGEGAMNDVQREALMKQVEITVNCVMNENLNNPKGMTYKQIYRIMHDRLVFVRSVRSIGTGIIAPIHEKKMTVEYAAEMAWEKAPAVAANFTQVSFDDLMALLSHYQETYLRHDIEFLNTPEVRQICEDLIAALKMNQPGASPDFTS